MNRTLQTAVVATGLLLAGSVLAQTDEEAPPLRVDVGYATSRLFRGVERAGDSAQAGMELNRGRFRGGMWLNQAFDRNDAGEFNLNAGYAWQTSGGFGLGVTVQHTWFSDVPGVDRSLEAGLLLGMASVGGFTPSLAYYRDVRFDADTVEVSFAREVPLTKLGAFLELHFYAGLVQGDDWRPDAPGPRMKDGYGYWGGEARLPYRVGPHATVVAGLHLGDSYGRSIANGPFGRHAGVRLSVTLGVSLDF